MPDLPTEPIWDIGFTGLDYASALKRQAAMNDPDCDGGGWSIVRDGKTAWAVTRGG